MIDKYLSKAGLVIRQETVKKVLIANEIEEKDWERIVKETVEEYIRLRDLGIRVPFLELLSQICYSYNKRKPKPSPAITYNRISNMPAKLAKLVEEKNAVIYDKNNRKVYIKGSLENFAIYLLDDGKVVLVKKQASLPEAIQMTMNIIKGAATDSL